MNDVKTIVFTWLSTAKGGAEESTLSTCHAINVSYKGITAKVVLWENYENTDAYPDFVMLCKSYREYNKTLSDVLLGDPKNTVLYSNHRTYQTDIPIALSKGVKFCVVFRAIPFQNESFRTTDLQNPTTLTYQNALNLNWKLLCKAEVLIGVSHFCANKISEVAPPKSNVRCIYNGLAPKFFQKATTKNEIKRILIASRLSKWKSIDVGIRAFALVLQSNPFIRLIIAGNGEEEVNLKELVSNLKLQNHVDFLGYHKDMASLYMQCDCLLHTCPLESFGRTVVEASASGILTIAPQNGGTGELIIHKQTGFTFVPNDIKSCAEILKFACTLSENEYANITSLASNRIQSLFKLDRVVEDYVGIANFAINS